MAHVKVVRRSMRPEEWTDLRFVWLQRGIYEDKFEITDLEIRDARQISEDQYEYYSDEYRPLKKDDMYFTPDGTAFIRGHVQIPAHMKGKNIYFTLHTAAEMIVKINGKYVGGVDPNRERILLNPYIDSDDLTIEIEAYNRSKPDDERNPASLAHRGCRQIFEGAYLSTIRDNVQSLVYDYILFMDIAHSEYFNEDYRKFLFRELSKALDFIDFDTYEGVDQDGPDGRDGWGGGRKIHKIKSAHTTEEDIDKRVLNGSVMLNLIYGMDENWMNIQREREEKTQNDLSAVFSHLWNQEHERQKAVMEQSGRVSETARQLAVSAQAHLTRRDSTDGMSIMAGFPFFGDWGRDTMIAFYGCTLAIGQMEAAKSILQTFMRYCRRGIMPNLFPEGKDEVMYNTVDASLLFINALWEYLQHVTEKECDPSFEAEAIKTAESIISWYKKGTDYNIHMEGDGLLAAGNGLWQLTWMDVRFGDILPTPRHGKPVEINAYWYNAVCIVRELLKKQGEEEKAARLDVLSEKIKKSFLKKFTKPDGTLYDVLPENGEPDDASKQVRCNEIFALTMPFTMIEAKQAKAILAQVRRELYTPVGLRSLSLYDPQFHPHYGGTQFERDMAYHQGTVWAYPLGAYYRACIRFSDEPKQTAKEVLHQLDQLNAALAEGCLGQIAEIYDGECPAESRGCFAQAWSVAELLRAYEDAETAVVFGRNI